MKRYFEGLEERYPLPDGWRITEYFYEEPKILGHTFYSYGVMSEHESGLSTCGSASGLVSDNGGLRAYFENLERCSVLTSLTLEESTDPLQWQYSKSNGVACHTSLIEAQKKASFELFERHLILHSWYGYEKPQRVFFEMPIQSELYRFEHYIVTSTEDVFILGICLGIPLDEQYPVVMGFQVSIELKKSLTGATAEALQRLAFLWGEEIKEPKKIDFSPTPHFHSEFYLHLNSLGVIMNWLEGNHLIYSEKKKVFPSLDSLSVVYNNFTPKNRRQYYQVIQAISNDLIPLTFGKCKKWAPSAFPEALLVHPIA